MVCSGRQWRDDVQQEAGREVMEQLEGEEEHTSTSEVRGLPQGIELLTVLQSWLSDQCRRLASDALINACFLPHSRCGRCL